MTTPSLLVGDDTGLIKLVRRKDSAILRKFGSQALGRGITHMALAYPSIDQSIKQTDKQPLNQSISQIPTHLITAHSDCTISVFDWVSTELIGSHKFDAPVTGLIVLPVGTLSFENQTIDPTTNQSIIVTCSSKGELSAQPLSNLITPKSSDDQPKDESMDQSVLTWSLDGPISCLASNPFALNQIAAAGRENLLRIFDMSTGETVWRAKNVKHDKLNMRPAVDPTCIAFVDAHRLIEGTATRCLRLYDSKLKRMALWNVTTGESVVTCCGVSGENLAFVGDGGSALSVFDMCTHMRIGGYKGGCQGSVRGIAVNQSENLLASASMDRYVRVYDITKRTLIQKVYLKQKLNCCMFVNDAADPTAVKQEDDVDVKPDVDMENGDDEDVDEDELWGELERRRVQAKTKSTDSVPLQDVVKIEDSAIKVEDDDSDVEDMTVKHEVELDDDSDVIDDENQIEQQQPIAAAPSKSKSKSKSKSPTSQPRQSIKQSTKSDGLSAATKQRKGFALGRRIGAKKA